MLLHLHSHLHSHMIGINVDLGHICSVTSWTHLGRQSIHCQSCQVSVQVAVAAVVMTWSWLQMGCCCDVIGCNASVFSHFLMSCSQSGICHWAIKQKRMQTSQGGLRMPVTQRRLHLILWLYSWMPKHLTWQRQHKRLQIWRHCRQIIY